LVRQELVNAYDNTILYTDYLVNRVIQLLQWLDGTASVMLYMSDHGESLSEHGLYLHGVPMSIAPTVQTSVPLVV
jgi:lipid A ethanolaminephosphotransferase